MKQKIAHNSAIENNIADSALSRPNENKISYAGTLRIFIGSGSPWKPIDSLLHVFVMFRKRHKVRVILFQLLPKWLTGYLIFYLMCISNR